MTLPPPAAVDAATAGMTDTTTAAATANRAPSGRERERERETSAAPAETGQWPVGRRRRIYAAGTIVKLPLRRGRGVL